MSSDLISEVSLSNTSKIMFPAMNPSAASASTLPTPERNLFSHRWQETPLWQSLQSVTRSSSHREIYRGSSFSISSAGRLDRWALQSVLSNQQLVFPYAKIARAAVYSPISKSRNVARERALERRTATSGIEASGSVRLRGRPILGCYGAPHADIHFNPRAEPVNDSHGQDALPLMSRIIPDLPRRGRFAFSDGCASDDHAG